MAFSPIALPIQEILLTNFVTDIATISNSNDLLLQSTLEDLINNLEIDTAGLTIGSTNAITSVKTKSLILQDTGFIYQTGSPSTIIAKLEKDTNSKSILTLDKLISNTEIDANVLNVNTLNINSSITSTKSTVSGTLQFDGQLVESKSASSIINVVKDSTTAKGTLLLTSTSPKNIFVTLSVTSGPDLNPVYSGSSLNNIDLFELKVDFDQTNPPSENSAFTIYIVDIIENQSEYTIMPAVISALSPIVIRPGVYGVNPIYLHSGPTGLGATTYDVGINPNSTNVASNILKSNIPTTYGSNLSLLYIKDKDNNDRLIITGMTAMEFFNP